MASESLSPSTLVKGILNQANPFSAIRPVLSSTVQALIPYVDIVGAQTTGLIIGDGALAFFMTLLFMISLIVILLSDRVNMTRSLRATFANVHFALLRVTRCIVTVGLFFVGRRIGQAGEFSGAYEASSAFIETTAITWSLQKLIEYFSAVAQSGISAYDPDVFDPVFKQDGFFQTVMQVIYDYLALYNNMVLNAMIGNANDNCFATTRVTTTDVLGMDNAGAASIGNFKTIFQMYRGNYGSGAVPALSSAEVWFYSPLFAGVVVGMFA
jgi:hypothetical protein